MAFALAATAAWVTNARNQGGTYAGYPWRIVLHTVEGSSSAGLAGSHPYPPHVWYNPATRQLWQTVPFDRSAFALYRAPGGVETNKANALQVEISGRAQDTPNWPNEWLTNLAEDVVVPMCRFVAEQGGQIDLSDVPAAGAIPGSASEFAPQRMASSRWATFRGLCGHRHVPTNDHWDPGAMDVQRIAAHAALVIGGLLEEVPPKFSSVSIPDPRRFPMNLCLTPAGLYLLVASDRTFTILNAGGESWEYVNSQMVGLARAGLVASHPDGSPVISNLNDDAIKLLRERK